MCTLVITFKKKKKTEREEKKKKLFKLYCTTKINQEFRKNYLSKIKR